MRGLGRNGAGGGRSGRGGQPGNGSRPGKRGRRTRSGGRGGVDDRFEDDRMGYGRLVARLRDRGRQRSDRAQTALGEQPAQAVRFFVLVGGRRRGVPRRSALVGAGRRFRARGGGRRRDRLDVLGPRRRHGGDRSDRRIVKLRRSGGGRSGYRPARGRGGLGVMCRSVVAPIRVFEPVATIPAVLLLPHPARRHVAARRIAALSRRDPVRRHRWPGSRASAVGAR